MRLISWALQSGSEEELSLVLISSMQHGVLKFFIVHPTFFEHVALSGFHWYSLTVGKLCVITP
jgi:hypothetical protein